MKISYLFLRIVRVLLCFLCVLQCPGPFHAEKNVLFYFAFERQFWGTFMCIPMISRISLLPSTYTVLSETYRFLVLLYPRTKVGGYMGSAIVTRPRPPPPQTLSCVHSTGHKFEPIVSPPPIFRSKKKKSVQTNFRVST